MESTARKGFLYKSTKEFNEIDEEQQLDKTSNNFPKLNKEYFYCACEHCYIMPSLIENKCCRGVQIIQQKLINEKCITSTPSFNKLCLDTEVLEVLMCSVKQIIGENLEQHISNR